ncbi:LysR family transcriptional regulator [Pseudoduganella chitinolytica]|uniref:LysR family transcriptional regulator n=1 Tax=Pseudoduganella chitinolytica TaxID=34070 RepID=A0ABY8B7L1_9BURK|nr:LysR family transcriptional regulator [Pseudoduganella chitinolytica]WEF31880.1 LysR family transcriptional regulator [Pseudoduganella chitinolytica]
MRRHFDDVLVGSIELFCAAAEQGSFTAAAHALGVTPAAVSRSVARLEARLGAQLFVRTTRQMSLTEAGRRYLEQCRQGLALLIDAERTVTGTHGQPAGVVRISAPTTYGHHRLLPLLPRFRMAYPDVQVEIHVSNRNIDFVDDGYDLAIRARELPDSRLVAHKLEDAELVVVAAPGYLAARGRPDAIAALAQHDCINFALPRTGRPVPWLLRDQGKAVEVAVAGSCCVFEDLLAGVTLARSGGGLFQAYRFTVEEDLRAGTLVEVLGEHGGCARPFSVLYPHGRHLPLRVRALVDFLLATVPGR